MSMLLDTIPASPRGAWSGYKCLSLSTRLGMGEPRTGGLGGKFPQDGASQEDPGGAPWTQGAKARPWGLLTQPGKQL